MGAEMYSKWRYFRNAAFRRILVYFYKLDMGDTVNDNSCAVSPRLSCFRLLPQIIVTLPNLEPTTSQAQVYHSTTKPNV